MATLFGREYTRQELLSKVDDISQVAGVRPARLQYGPEDGVPVADVWTGSGFRFTVVPGRGMDISAAEFCGMSLCPRAACRESHAAYFEPGSQGWRRGFFEGLLTTCGPTFYTDPPGPHELRPANHGRATYTPARNVSYDERWVGDDYVLAVRGRMREGALTWERTITTEMGAMELQIHDVVENQGFKPIPHRFQYHINAGFPLIDEGAEFMAASLGLFDRGLGEPVSPDWRRIGPPDPDYRGRTNDELMVADEEGYALGAMVNRNLAGGLGYWVRYRIDTLPYFFLWKSELPDRYIVGTEPTSHIPVNSYDPRNDSGQPLEPLLSGEVREYHIEIGVLSGGDEIAALEGRMADMVAAYRRSPTPERIGRTQSGQHGF